MTTKWHTLLLLVLLSLYFISCSKSDNTTNPVILSDFEKDSILGLTFGDSIKAIHLTNSFGNITINGWNFHDSMRVYMQKKISAADEETAERYFTGFSCGTKLQADTLALIIVSPENNAEVTFDHLDISVNIPSELICKVFESAGFTFADQLSNDLTVLSSKKSVQVQRHIGSCRITSEEDINVQSYLLVDGTCNLASLHGDISLAIPDHTSSLVSAYAASGEIKYSGLVFNSVTISGQTMTGVLGSGDGMIDLRTDDGDILLRGYASRK
ncbi:MAG: DUF4097 family beta strand repeat protein [Calditrichaceae bacterium]|nr:DUF4097 family beta strand repeat protein [Calditrichaceae bacterium]RQV96020.1 MAG: hypothetical protein EH224_05850 [Calditrichota bacterium]